MDTESDGTIREPRSQKSEATVNEGSRGKSDANKANSGHMPTPQEWFKLQPNVCDNIAEKILNMFRAGDERLGNRRPNEHGKSYK